jgi:hypothetical protein
MAAAGQSLAAAGQSVAAVGQIVAAAKVMPSLPLQLRPAAT